MRRRPIAEADHQALDKAIDTAFAHAKSDQRHETEIAADIETINRLAHAILKRGWQSRHL